MDYTTYPPAHVKVRQGGPAGLGEGEALGLAGAEAAGGTVAEGGDDKKPINTINFGGLPKLWHSYSQACLCLLLRMCQEQAPMVYAGIWSAVGRGQTWLDAVGRGRRQEVGEVGEKIRR